MSDRREGRDARQREHEEKRLGIARRLGKVLFISGRFSGIQ